MPFPPLTLADLRHSLPEAYVERGAAYARHGQVRHLRQFPDEARYEARVAGSGYEPYKVEVRLQRSARGTQIFGVCTCPMKVNCKHVAAVLLRALEVQGVPPDGAEEVSPRVAAAPSSALPPELGLWLESARRASQQAPRLDNYAPNVLQRLLYVLDTIGSLGTAALRVSLVVARRLKAGGYGGAVPWQNAHQALHSKPGFVLSDDQRILRALLIDSDRPYSSEYVLKGDTATGLLPVLLATGRCHWRSVDSPALSVGAPREASGAWRFDASGAQHFVFDTEPASEAVLALAPPWYLDTQRHECGPVRTALPPMVAETLASAPPVPADHASGIRAALEQQLGNSGIPLPQIPDTIEVEDAIPVPCLRMLTLKEYATHRYRHEGREHYLDIATLTFDYLGLRANRDSPGVVTRFQDGKLLRVKRHLRAEKQAHLQLKAIGFIKVAEAGRLHLHEYRHDYTLPNEASWLDFMGDQLGALRTKGWRIEFDENFRLTPAELGNWYARIEPSSNDWFDLRLEVDIDGKRTNLIEILLAAIRDRPDLLSRDTIAGAVASDKSVFLNLRDGRLLPVPLSRLQPLILILHDMLDESPHVVRLPRLDVVRLADLEDAVELNWQGGEALRKLGRRLSEFERVTPIVAPAEFHAQLRPYQEHGVAWLQFLREYELGGILADDMGLGKTVQALAHILIEKQAGRLDRPALVIAPTSVIPNWKAEAARFAPGLRVHVSHGLKRKEVFDQITDSDLVLTTYALLPRDKEALLAQEFHLVLLDEAQQIKNAQTLAAKVVSQLHARHRLCLTGTPLENHLGELWSLFHFLMPGLLGDVSAFRRTYRTPIEKYGDELRRHGLVRRIRPFLLRRTKEQVATELPAKTEIVLPVELAGRQRDLYETVRASMHERVREEITARGLAQSQIVVLDALLKLRQVCCDPRLLKLDSAKRVKESAKLEVLLEMLREMLPQGRRVLLFSQFTSMLALIEQELSAESVRYVKLTGDTRDREKPVKAFQSGEVPLFLISLKAGGTGLNLTAADTVIHYDPWWNPAVENQATDRAHRIGQNKPVFVYKLIASGSVEEKIGALQASKAALAASVLGGGAATGAALTADDIRALFEPMG